MPNTVVKVLRTDKPGNSLAVWLAGHHPDLFVTMFKHAQAARVATAVQKRGLRGFGQDVTVTDTGITTSFDAPAPDLSAVTAPDVTLEPVNVDISALDSLPSNLLTDANTSGADALANIGGATTSAGDSLAGTLGNIGSSVLGALGSVGSYLTSTQGLNTLAGVAKSYFGAQGATATAQTQQAVLQAQLGRATVGQPVAPITYTRNAAGQLVPVYATNTPQGAVYHPLTSQGLASLTPSSASVFLAKYGLYVGLAGLLALGLYMRGRG